MKPRKGSVFMTKAGEWRGVVELPRKKGEERKKKVFYGDNSKPDKMQESDLWNQVNDLIYEIEHGLYIDETNATLEQYAREWHKVYAAEKAETTQELYMMYINKHIAPYDIGKKKIKDIVQMDVQAWLNALREKGLGNTVVRLFTFLNRIFNDAVNDKKIRENPFKGLKRPKDEEYEATPYTEEQVGKLLGLISGTFDEVVILLASTGGLRRGEIFGIRTKEDLNFVKNLISIQETKVRFMTKKIKKPKSKKSKRIVPVPAFVMGVIKNYLDSLDFTPERLCDCMQPQSYSEHFKKLLERNKLPHIRLHDMRHFNATIMLEYGVPDKVAQRRLGHARAETLKNIYQHSNAKMESEAVEIIEDVFVNQILNQKPKEHPYGLTIGTRISYSIDGEVCWFGTISDLNKDQVTGMMKMDNGKEIKILCEYCKKIESQPQPSAAHPITHPNSHIIN